jgi:hypothetical protein
MFHYTEDRLYTVQHLNIILVSKLFIHNVHIYFFMFLYIFWRARVRWPLLSLCRLFMIFEKCLDSNPEGCRISDV